MRRCPKPDGAVGFSQVRGFGLDHARAHLLQPDRQSERRTCMCAGTSDLAGAGSDTVRCGCRHDAFRVDGWSEKTFDP